MDRPLGISLALRRGVSAKIRQIVQHATQEFHDGPEKLTANLTRLKNRYNCSERGKCSFCQVLLEAEAVTKQAGTMEKLQGQPDWQDSRNATGPPRVAPGFVGHDLALYARPSRAGS